MLRGLGGFVLVLGKDIDTPQAFFAENKLQLTAFSRALSKVLICQ